MICSQFNHFFFVGVSEPEGFHYPAYVGFNEGQDMDFTEFDNITLVLQGRVPPSLEESVTTAWKVNGKSLPTDYLGPLHGPLLSISQMLSIKNANFLDAGEYIATLEVDPYTYLSEHLQCPHVYFDFVSNTLGIDSITLAQAVIRLNYGKEVSNKYLA